jgi:hypothetical protein
MNLTCRGSKRLKPDLALESRYWRITATITV